ncbi:MAG TPA: FAD-binding oxidoreductase [Pedomonas sp.]|uniref:NAD(P)/FAD-dependent oxidoreductase n=1 Tax=Pedomonas sp. TaxID=2976421 RepID=UPI002F42144C
MNQRTYPMTLQDAAWGDGKMKCEKQGGLTRRSVVTSGAGMLLAAGTAGGCVRRDRGAEEDRRATSVHDIYDRGLVPIDRSGWTRPEGVTAPYPPLERSLNADVVVVGAGLAGSSLALHLAEAGVKVVVLEARQPGWGASGRNAGHVLPILKDLKVLERFPDQGKAFIEIFREHHTIPFDLSQKHGIECDAVRSGYLNAMTGQADFDDFREKSAYLEKMGFQKVVPLRGEDMKAMTGTGYYPFGVLYENGGRVNPYLFTNGMIAAAVRLGAVVHGDSEALKLLPAGARWRVETERGDVTADRVVFCTNAYPNGIVPDFERCFYPLTAYALATQPLPDEALARIMPGGATLAQVPVDLNPLVKDRHGRLILSSIPSVSRPEDAAWHFQSQLGWIHKVWPETREMKIRLGQYWTGRVAMRDKEFPGVFDMGKGVLGLMHFNAWGNVMAPLMGRLLAEGIAGDRLDALPFPLEKPQPVSSPGKQEFLIRHLLIPAARFGQRIGLI